MRLISILMLLAMVAGSSVAQQQKQADPKALGWSYAAIAASTLDQDQPAPKPDKTPGSVCPSCEGSGKVGDGRVFTKCLDCNGTGVVPSKQITKPPVIQPLTFGDPDCPDGRCDLKPKPSVAKIESTPVIRGSCPGGVCLPAPSKSYPVYRPTVIRRGWIFRR